MGWVNKIMLLYRNKIHNAEIYLNPKNIFAEVSWLTNPTNSFSLSLRLVLPSLQPFHDGTFRLIATRELVARRSNPILLHPIESHVFLLENAVNNYSLKEKTKCRDDEKTMNSRFFSMFSYSVVLRDWSRE